MHPYLPEGEVAVGVGVRGEVPAVGGESHRSYWSFVAVDSLQEGERTGTERIHYLSPRLR